MKLWKSPVFYFGIVLVLAVVAALSAPYVIDWGKYRTAMETYGRKLTGREVTIGGPIAVRLFPWPKLVMDDVEVANPVGAVDKQFLKAERIDVRVTLAGLFNGEIQVETVDIIKPEISLERMAAGQWTWRMTPSAGVAKSKLLDHVKLDKVAIRDGRLRLIDGRRGGSAVIGNVYADLSAPEIIGPWRVRGTGSYKNQPLAVTIATGNWRADEALRLAVRVAPADGSGLVYDFDGEDKDDALTGTLRIAQAAAEDGKGDAEGAFRPLVLTSKVEADFDKIALSNIAIAARDDEKSGDLLSGNAQITLGKVLNVSADLTASKFNLDAVAGAKAKALWREGGALMLLSDALAALPDGIDGRGSLRIASLIAGNEKLQNVLLSGAITPDAIRIHELSAGLPGQTAALLKGIFIAGGGGPQLAGDLSVEAADMRSLVTWIWPERKDELVKLWSGNRGRLKLETRFDAGPNRLRLSNASYQIDDSIGSGSFAYLGGDHPKIDFKLDSSIMDIDSFVPGGISAVSAGDQNSFAGAANGLSALLGGADADISISAKQLLLNGVSARNAVVDAKASPKGVEFRKFEIGDVSGASLEVSGLVSHVSDHLSGSLQSKVKAEDPRGLLRLIGLAPNGGTPDWFAPLGKTDMQLSAVFRPEPDAQAATLDLSGKSGNLEFAGSVGLRDSLDWTKARIAGSAEIKSYLSSPILQLAGLAPVVTAEAPGSVNLTLVGSLAEGIRGELQANLLGAMMQFQGTANGSADDLKAKGRAAVSSDKPQGLFLAFGLEGADSKLFSAESEIIYEKGKLSISSLNGVTAGAPFSGAISVDAGRVLSGTLEIPRLRLEDFLAQLYLPWNGKAPDTEAPFAKTLPFDLQGEIWIKPQALTVLDGFEVREAQIGLTASQQEIKLAIFGKTEAGDNVALDLASKTEADGRSFDGKLTLPIDLAGRLKAADGKPVATGSLLVDGHFLGSGRSPASVLAGLNGNGSYKLRGVSFGQIEPEGFAGKIAQAKSQADVDAALSDLVSGKSLSVSDTTGTITIQDGVVSFLPVKLQTPAADAVIKPLAELQSGQIDIGIALQLKELPGVPGLEVAYAGQPMSLKRSVDSAALQSHLGMQVLQKGVDELERLQGEQKRIAAQEEQARIEDAARLAAYESKRREIRQRQRELRVYRRLQDQEIKRQEALKGALEAEQAKAQPVEEPVRPAKPKSRPAKPVDKKPDAPLGPLVIVPPAEPPRPPVKTEPPKPPPPKNLFDFLNQL